MAGLTHPVLGFDHLLAMLSVGILSAQMGGLAIWRVPLTFVLVMLGGGVLGINGIPLFSVELGIALSVLALGVAIALEKKLSPVLAMIFVGFFAIFHGSGVPYSAKFYTVIKSDFLFLRPGKRMRRPSFLGKLGLRYLCSCYAGSQVPFCAKTASLNHHATPEVSQP